jgi:hypothetical protein
MEMVYGYLTGPRFRQQFRPSGFFIHEEDLDREKKASRHAKREEQIDRVMQATVGMYGDLQGIAETLQEIEGLEFQDTLEVESDEAEAKKQQLLFSK